jgi:hypothetical protein
MKNKSEVILTKDIENFIRWLRYEAQLSSRLKQMQDMTETKLRILNECKIITQRMRDMRRVNGFKFSDDKELVKAIMRFSR